MAQRLQMVRTKFERLAKRLSLSGLVSRHEAEQALREGHVHVNGVVATTNFEVPDVAEVHLHGKLIPPPVIRLWAFNKPRRVLCHMGEKEGIATLTTLFAKWFNIERERVGKTIIESVGFDDRELRHFNIGTWLEYAATWTQQFFAGGDLASRPTESITVACSRSW
eukprot:GEMP01064739.1.p1 GENE.GEMP01064739.1~~GEMP01064739.1.p1  ORF type:complete len:166 (+),score=47.29 GEMP01064739.1:245-742(+)